MHASAKPLIGSLWETMAEVSMHSQAAQAARAAYAFKIENFNKPSNVVFVSRGISDNTAGLIKIEDKAARAVCFPNTRF